MNAVGADQQVAVRRGAMAAGAVEEMGGNTGVILVKGAEPMAGMDPLIAKPRADRLVDDAAGPR